MTAPNLGNLVLHAYAKVTGATGAVTDAVNIIDVTRSGPGIYLVNLATEIDDTQRFVAVTPNAAVDASVIKNVAGQTDSVVAVLAFDAIAAAADIDFEVAVYRISTPS